MSMSCEKLHCLYLIAINTVSLRGYQNLLTVHKVPRHHVHGAVMFSRGQARQPYY